MDLKTILLTCISLAIGALGGWMLRAPQEAPKTHESSALPSRKERSTQIANPRVRNSNNNSAENNEQILQLKKLHGKLSLSELSRAEIEALIHTLADRTNPGSPLDWDDRKLLDSLIKELLQDENPEQIAHWAGDQFPKGVRAYVLEGVSSHLMETDFDSGLLFANEHLDAEEMDRYAGKLLLNSGSSDPINTHRAISLLEFVTARSGCSGTNIKFTNDFDFQKFGELALDIQDREKKLSSFPNNIFKEWAKRDVDGAMAFYNQFYLDEKRELPMNNFGDLVEGYVNSVPTDESAPWLSEILLANDLPTKTREPLLGKLAAGPLSEHLRDEVLANLESPSDQAQLVGELYLHLDHWSGGSIPEKRAELLASFPSPEARMDFLNNQFKFAEDHPAGENLDGKITDLTAQLRLLGHTEDEIQSVTNKLTAEP